MTGRINPSQFRINSRSTWNSLYHSTLNLRHKVYQEKFIKEWIESWLLKSQRFVAKVKILRDTNNTLAISLLYSKGKSWKAYKKNTRKKQKRKIQFKFKKLKKLNLNKRKFILNLISQNSNINTKKNTQNFLFNQINKSKDFHFAKSHLLDSKSKKLLTYYYNETKSKKILKNKIMLLTNQLFEKSCNKKEIIQEIRILLKQFNELYGKHSNFSNKEKLMWLADKNSKISKFDYKNLKISPKYKKFIKKLNRKQWIEFQDTSYKYRKFWPNLNNKVKKRIIKKHIKKNIYLKLRNRDLQIKFKNLLEQKLTKNTELIKHRLTVYWLNKIINNKTIDWKTLTEEIKNNKSINTKLLEETKLNLDLLPNLVKQNLNLSPDLDKQNYLGIPNCRNIKRILKKDQNIKTVRKLFVNRNKKKYNKTNNTLINKKDIIHTARKEEYTKQLLRKLKYLLHILYPEKKIILTARRIDKFSDLEIKFKKFKQVFKNQRYKKWVWRKKIKIHRPFFLLTRLEKFYVRFYKLKNKIKKVWNFEKPLIQKFYSKPTLKNKIKKFNNYKAQENYNSKLHQIINKYKKELYKKKLQNKRYWNNVNKNKNIKNNNKEWLMSWSKNEWKKKKWGKRFTWRSIKPGKLSKINIRNKWGLQKWNFNNPQTFWTPDGFLFSNWIQLNLLKSYNKNDPLNQWHYYYPKYIENFAKRKLSIWKPTIDKRTNYDQNLLNLENFFILFNLFKTLNPYQRHLLNIHFSPIFNSNFAHSKISIKDLNLQNLKANILRRQFKNSLNHTLKTLILSDIYNSRKNIHTLFPYISLPSHRLINSKSLIDIENFKNKKFFIKQKLKSLSSIRPLPTTNSQFSIKSGKFLIGNYLKTSINKTNPSQIEKYQNLCKLIKLKKFKQSSSSSSLKNQFKNVKILILSILKHKGFVQNSLVSKPNLRKKAFINSQNLNTSKYNRNITKGYNNCYKKYQWELRKLEEKYNIKNRKQENIYKDKWKNNIENWVSKNNKK